MVSKVHCGWGIVMGSAASTGYYSDYHASNNCRVDGIGQGDGDGAGFGSLNGISYGFGFGAGECDELGYGTSEEGWFEDQ